MKKVISVQPHVIERRAAGFPDIGTGFNVTFSELRDVGIAFEGLSGNVLHVMGKTARFALDPLRPGINSNDNIVYFSTNSEKDQYRVSRQNPNGTVDLLWSVQMPGGQNLVDAIAPANVAVSYLILKNDLGEYSVYQLNHQLGASPVPLNIRGGALRFLHPSANAASPETYLIDGTKLKILTLNGLTLSESGLAFEFGSNISDRSYSSFLSGGIHVGLPDMAAVAFIPSEQLSQLPPTNYTFFTSPDPCDVNPIFRDAVTMFKSTPGSKFGSSFYLLNIGNSTVSFIGKPGVSQVVAMPVRQDGACLTMPIAILQGEHGFGKALNKEVDINPQSGSNSIRANYMPITQRDDSMTLVPFNMLQQTIGQGAGRTVAIRDMNPIKISSLIPPETLGGDEASLNGGKFLSIGNGSNVQILVFPKSDASGPSFSDAVLDIQAQRQPVATASSSSLISSSQRTVTPPRTTNTVLASVTSATLALTTSAFQQITNNTETETSSGSSSAGGLSLPYLLIIVGVGIIILVLLVIAAKVTRSHRNATGPRDAENPSLTAMQVVHNPVYQGVEAGPQYEDIDKFKPPVPTSAKPSQRGDDLYLLPTPLKKVGSVSNPTYDSAMQESEEGTILYDIATMQKEPGHEDAFSTDGEPKYYMATPHNGYLDVDPENT